MARSPDANRTYGDAYIWAEVAEMAVLVASRLRYRPCSPGQKAARPVDLLTTERSCPVRSRPCHHSRQKNATTTSTLYRRVRDRARQSCRRSAFDERWSVSGQQDARCGLPTTRSKRTRRPRRPTRMISAVDVFQYTDATSSTTLSATVNGFRLVYST